MSIGLIGLQWRETQQKKKTKTEYVKKGRKKMVILFHKWGSPFVNNIAQNGNSKQKLKRTNKIIYG